MGQSEVEVAGAADTTIVLLAPGMGDGIQAAKAGILEIGDIFVVNKADRDGADATVRELRHMISLGPSGQAGAWKPPVLKVVATRARACRSWWRRSTGTGRGWSPRAPGRPGAARRARSEIQGIALAALQARFAGVGGDGALDGLADDVAAGRTDAFTAADRIVAEVAG